MLFLKTIYKKNCSFINYSAFNLFLSVLKNSDNLLQNETKNRLKLRRGLEGKILTKRTQGDERGCTFPNRTVIPTLIPDLTFTNTYHRFHGIFELLKYSTGAILMG